MKTELLERQIQRPRLLTDSLTVSATTTIEIPEIPDTEDFGEDLRIAANQMKKQNILLVSDDLQFDSRMRSVVRAEGHLFKRVESFTDALRTLLTGRPCVTLVDLDMADEVAWDAADWLLQNSKSPPVILMTNRQEPLDIRMAVHSGAIVHKSSSPERILCTVNQLLQAPRSVLEERNGIQRVVIRWLRPLRWPEPFVPAGRHWGINE